MHGLRNPRLIKNISNHLRDVLLDVTETDFTAYLGTPDRILINHRSAWTAALWILCIEVYEQAVNELLNHKTATSNGSSDVP